MSKFVEKLETYDPLVLRDMMQELRAENKTLKQQAKKNEETIEGCVKWELAYFKEASKNEVLVSKIKRYHEFIGGREREPSKKRVIKEYIKFETLFEDELKSEKEVKS